MKKSEIIKELLEAEYYQGKDKDVDIKKLMKRGFELMSQNQLLELLNSQRQGKQICEAMHKHRGPIKNSP